MTSSDSREARFLEARAARYHQSTTNSNATATNKKVDDLHQFWSRFRSEVALWKDQLQELQLKRTSNGGEEQSLTLASDQRVHLRVVLAQLQSDLLSLRKHCLSSTNTAASTSIHNDNNNNDVKYEDWEIPEDFPLTDLRLLHTEFSNCAAQLETTRNALFPKAKFVFHRYRQAKLKQQKHKQNQPCTKKKNLETSSVLPTDKDIDSIAYQEHHHHQRQQKKNLLEDQNHVWIRVRADGQVFSCSKDEDVSTFEETTGYIQKDNFLGGGDEPMVSMGSVAGEHSMVIRNVQRARIELQNAIQELHISNISECTILVNSEKIRGALHVTGCQHVRIVLRSYHQMRLHESIDFYCHIENATACGGTIMEDCSRVVFCMACNDDDDEKARMKLEQDEDAAYKLLDVKDFNWLRKGVPSPNFRVQVDSTNSRKEDIEIAKKAESSKEEMASHQPIVVSKDFEGKEAESKYMQSHEEKQLEDHDNDDEEDEL